MAEESLTFIRYFPVLKTSYKKDIFPIRQLTLFQCVISRGQIWPDQRNNKQNKQNKQTNNFQNL
jgi:hypothetical protein